MYESLKFKASTSPPLNMQYSFVLLHVIFNIVLRLLLLSIIPELSHYVWPGSCTVESLLISSCQIFQAAVIFKKWASQQVLHGLL